jgi:outer membrane protein TolC
MVVDTARVVAEAYANRSDAIGFIRRLIEAKRDVAKARGENGLNATLTARVGFSKSAQSLGKVYQSPLNQQAFQLQFDIPILDWGRSKSRTKTRKRLSSLPSMPWSRTSKILHRKFIRRLPCLI